MPWIPSAWITPLAAIVFTLTYAGVAVGGVPGLAVDRTGLALLGAIAMVAVGALSLEAALASIDAPTLLLLYALMVVSAQFRAGGFYSQTVLSLGRFIDRERLFLLVVMLAAAVLSAVLVNDVVCLAFTPVLAVSLLQAGLNPAPYLIGMAAASNIGSAATLIGNPQNLLIGQMGRLAFGPFLAWSAPPVLASLAAAYGVILFLYRGRLRGGPPRGGLAADWPALNRKQSAKGLAAVALLLALFCTAIPREVSALTVAGLLLCSRRLSTRDMLGQVDWHLITLFCGLFVVIGGVMATGLPTAGVAALERAGLPLANPAILALGSAALSNAVSNVPAVMLLIQFLDPGSILSWRVLALSSTLAGNLITVGSIANLITIEQARSYGIRITFREHARVGVPVTVASLGIVLLWIRLAG